MYRCLSCGGVFDYNELTRIREYRGEYQGVPAYETLRCCPVCNGDTEYCGEWKTDIGGRELKGER